MNVAGAYLAALRARGIGCLYVNSGTDFAPLMAAYGDAATGGGDCFPVPVMAGHENVVTGMAHGAYLMTGEPQAVMVHVNVGTANAVNAVINAARENVPLLITAGRTPVFEHGVRGARDSPTNWGQEMYDQAAMVREVVKWDYELRDARHVDDVVDRALAVASAHPRGPVYLTLPREVLAEPSATATPKAHTAPAAGPAPDPDAVALLADRIATAELPVVMTASSGADPRTVAALGHLCERHAIGVTESLPRYLNLASDHPFHLGHRSDRVLAGADVVLVLESDVPWMPGQSEPSADAFVAHAGVDPLFSRYPMRTHRSDLTITTTSLHLLHALDHALEARRTPATIDRRAGELTERAAAGRNRISARVDATRAAGGPIDKALLSVAVADLLDDDSVVFNEYWAAPQLLGLRRPGSYFFLPASGGLGWALPAALGAKHAAPDRTVIATVGDGAYQFANPAACHHASEKHHLPVLTVIANNSRWEAVDHAAGRMYPDGHAAGGDLLSDLAPSPAYARYAEASGGHGEQVTTRDQLGPALERALHAVQVDGRQAVVDVICA